MDKKAIQRDLYEIYEALYPLIQTSEGRKMFNTKLVKHFKYTPEEISNTLLISEGKEIKKEKKEMIREEILNIKQLDDLRDYYYGTLVTLFSAKEETNNINWISLAELKYLYSLISTLPIQTRKTKIDIYYMIKNYFDNEARTQDMMKNL